VSVTPTHRICQGVTDAPPPPLAGALAAWLRKNGEAVRVVDPRNEPADWSGVGPLWVHLEGNNWQWIQESIPPDEADLRFFGPEASRGKEKFTEVRIFSADPEGIGMDPAVLPITTYSGFGAQPGGLFRILASRFGQPRPLPLLLNELVYLVETFGAGHLLFDDEDLSASRDLLQKFEGELSHLPWAITWEGRASGRRVRAARDI
jgi:hypothetical protein